MFSKFSSWLGWGKSSETRHDEEKKKKTRYSLFRKSKRHQSLVAEPEPEPESPLTSSMLASWLEAGSGLENLLSSRLGVTTFRDFLSSEFSTENLDFWLACRLLETGERMSLGDRVEAIFSQFVVAGSPQEVSLDSRVREKLVQMREEPSRDMFKEAQAKIFTLMYRDSFPRFLASSMFKELQASVHVPSEYNEDVSADSQLVLEVNSANNEGSPEVKISVDSPDSGIGEDGLVRIDTVEKQFHSMINKM